MSAIRVRRIATGEGAALRDVRLRALADTPLAFGSTHAREAGYPAEHWERWAAAAGADGAAQALFVVDPRETAEPVASREPGAPGEPGASREPGAPGKPGASREPGAPGEAGTSGDPDVHPADAGERRMPPTRRQDRPSALLGLAFVVVDPGDPARANLYSMWVAPEARGTGAGRALLAAGVDWTRAHGVRTLRTAVTVGNDAAARLYAGAGFADTGAREPLGHSDAEVRVLELAL